MDLELRTQPARKGVIASKYKGVSYNSIKKLWFARISVRGKVITLGYSETEIGAAELYAEAKIFFGEGLRKQYAKKIPKWKRVQFQKIN